MFVLELSPADRAGTPDEVGTFITGSDILMDGGVTASYCNGPLAPT